VIFFVPCSPSAQITEKPLLPPRTRAGLDLSAEIDTLAGFSDVALRGLKVKLSKRGDKLVAIDGRGTLDGGKPLAVSLQNVANEPRRLRADATDAGQAMRLVGFYPNMQGGRVRLEVNLDGKGPAEKTGTLWVEDFRVLGDPVVSEVIGSAEAGGVPTGNPQHTPGRPGKRRISTPCAYRSPSATAVRSGRQLHEGRSRRRQPVRKVDFKPAG